MTHSAESASSEERHQHRCRPRDQDSARARFQFLIVTTKAPYVSAVVPPFVHWSTMEDSQNSAAPQVHIFLDIIPRLLHSCGLLVWKLVNHVFISQFRSVEKWEWFNFCEGVLVGGTPIDGVAGAVAPDEFMCHGCRQFGQA